MDVFVKLLLDAGASLLMLFSALLAALMVSVFVMFLLPSHGQASKKDIGGFLLRLFSVSALLKMAGVTATRFVLVTIVVTVLYLAAYAWAGKRSLDIIRSTGVQPVETVIEPSVIGHN